MALTAAEIAVLIKELEALAGKRSSLSQLRDVLADISNTDLSEISKGVVKAKDAVDAQTASNNASVVSLQARKRAAEEEAAAYAGSNKELQKRIKAQETALELERAMLLTGQSNVENIKAEEEALESLKSQLSSLKNQYAENKAIVQSLTKSGNDFAKSLFAGDKAGEQMLGSVRGLASSMGDLAVKKVASSKALGVLLRVLPPPPR